MDFSLMHAPLPEELVGSSEVDTACKYCGISYLILNKMECIKQKMKELENELQDYKIYKKEREDIKVSMEKSKITIENLECERNELSRQLGFAKDEKGDLLDHIMMLNSQKEVLDQTIQAYVIDKKCYLRHYRDKVSAIHFALNQMRQSWNKELKEMKEIKYNVAKQQREHLISIIHTINKNSLQKIKQKEAEHERNRISQEEEHRNQIQLFENLLTESKMKYTEVLRHQNYEHEKLTEATKQLEELTRKFQVCEEELKSRNDTITNLNKTLEEKDYSYQNSRKMWEEKEKQWEMNETQIKHEFEICKEELANAKNSLHANHEIQKEKGMLDMANWSRSLAQKDQVIHGLKKELETQRDIIRDMQKERRDTIDAHQNRIKQLQDHFLKKLQVAGQEQADKVKNELTLQWEKEKQELISAFKEDLENKLEEMKNAHQQDLKKWMIDKSKEISEKDLKLIQAEKAWGSKLSDIEGEKLLLKEMLYRADQELLTSKNMLAEKEAQQSHASKFLEEFEEVKKKLQQKEKELSSVKEVVRLECQERIHLVSVIEQIKQQSLSQLSLNEDNSQNSASLPQLSSTHSSSNTLPSKKSSSQNINSNQPAIKEKSNSIPSFPNASKNSKEAAFEAMMLAAATKKLSKMSKQSSASSKYKY